MTVTSAPTRSAARPARRRILDTARTLFYAHGIHAVGIDRIIAEAAVAKATFYHHFPTKDDLVRSYLEEQSATQRAAARQVRDSGLAPQDQIFAVFEVIDTFVCGPGFRGCPFVNAAAEYPDPRHPVRAAVAAHRRWFRGMLREVLVDMRHPDPDSTAMMLALLRDGIVVGSDLDSPTAVSGLARTMVTRVLTAPPAARRPGGSGVR